jgi:RimJ/RimL family protein N-acetyltransferase
VIEHKILPRWLQYYDEHAHLGFWAAHDMRSDEFLGWFHLRPDRLCPGEIELGYRLKRAVWGRGYATEMASGLIRQGLTEWGMETIVARALVGNAASIRVMEKCGMRFAGLFSYSPEFLPGWSATERQAVKYSVRGTVR